MTKHKTGTREERLAARLLAIAATAGPAPAGDVVATVYKHGSALYVEPLPPQSLTCKKPVGEVGCPVARVWYGLANITPQQQADAEWFYAGPDLDRNWVLVVGHLARVTVRDHRTGDDPIEQTWFMVNKLYLTAFRKRVFDRHSMQFFYTTGTTSNAQVLAISRGEQSPRAAHITWTGLAASGSGGPSSVEDMFVTGQADFTRSPLPVSADYRFVRQTRDWFHRPQQ
jgi:hypothetical protein